ncbi:hypothetical protein ALC56_03771 [Trachymyrmex septentrionalis]|uniref:Uncharacterized protein n=1 Tax=Trachymyrmex septentrionalis TaxID=34720 RepID=A0A195FN66_9HYME|nr:hypothetical protein ALC56_03771 [Trachymyrmex septentrionalis]
MRKAYELRKIRKEERTYKEQPPSNDERCGMGGKIPSKLKLQSPWIRHGVAKSKRRPGIKTQVVRTEQQGEEDEADSKNRNEGETMKEQGKEEKGRNRER